MPVVPLGRMYPACERPTYGPPPSPSTTLNEHTEKFAHGSAGLGANAGSAILAHGPSSDGAVARPTYLGSSFLVSGSHTWPAV